MRKILIAVGRLDLQKGFDRLIEAFSPLALKHFDWDLVILGEGVLYAELEKQIKKLALKERVFLPGRVGNVHEWYKQADLYVMSSHFEGFPNTLVEAMSYGLPVVSFDCETGPRDIIREEVDGLLVPQDNVVELSAALDRLMSDSALRQRFAVRAKEVHERFSMKHIVGMWETLFEAVLHE